MRRVGLAIVAALWFAPAFADPKPDRPGWTAQPTAVDFSRHYPKEAMYAGISGEATLDCVVLEGGRLACEVSFESPEGAGFGAAALRVAERFRIETSLADGQSTIGGRLRVPIRFEVD